jgi:hypothetical protein
VVRLQEPVLKKERYHIAHPGYRLVRGRRTMMAIRRDTYLQFSELEMRREVNVEVFVI